MRFLWAFLSALVAGIFGVGAAALAPTGPDWATALLALAGLTYAGLWAAGALIGAAASRARRATLAANREYAMPDLAPPADWPPVGLELGGPWGPVPPSGLPGLEAMWEYRRPGRED